MSEPKEIRLLSGAEVYGHASALEGKYCPNPDFPANAPNYRELRSGGKVVAIELFGRRSV